MRGPDDLVTMESPLRRSCTRYYRILSDGQMT